MSTISDIKRAGASAMNTMYSGIPVHGLPTDEGKFAAFGLTESDVEYYCSRIADEIGEYYRSQVEDYGLTIADSPVSVYFVGDGAPEPYIAWSCLNCSSSDLTGSAYVPDPSRLSDPDYLFEQVSEALSYWSARSSC